MGFGDIQGYAHTDPAAPRAKKTCDSCGTWWDGFQLRMQMDWFGPTLQATGFLNCPRCYYVPNEQLKPIQLPADPVPIENPRPEYPAQDFGLQGFTQYTLVPTDPPDMSKTSVLATVAALSGVPTPGGVVDRSGDFAEANVAQQLMAANGARTWLLIYCPSVIPFGMSEGTAAFGDFSTIMLGSGEALFWADAQGAQPVYQGALSGVAQIAGAPFFAWESP